MLACSNVAVNTFFGNTIVRIEEKMRIMNSVTCSINCIKKLDDRLGMW